jgi:acyl homoserine lactone synthase
MRLLQTTGPHMLTDIFIDLLDGEPPLRSAQVWEATRFCIDTQKLKGGKMKNSISYYTSELMIGVFEYAQKAGITDIVGVVDPVMNRIMKRAGNAPYDYMGSTKPMGVGKAMVALMDCSDARIGSIRDFANIRQEVFLTEDEARSLYARSQDQEPELVQATDDPLCPKPRLSDLQRYCYEQFLNAEDERDILAATQLLNVLSSKVGTDDPGELKKLAKDIPSRKVDFELLEQEILRSA